MVDEDQELTEPERVEIPADASELAHRIVEKCGEFKKAGKKLPRTAAQQYNKTRHISAGNEPPYTVRTPWTLRSGFVAGLVGWPIQTAAEKGIVIPMRDQASPSDLAAPARMGSIDRTAFPRWLTESLSESESSAIVRPFPKTKTGSYPKPFVPRGS